MDDTEAKKFAHRFLCECIEHEYSSEPPQGLYILHPDEKLFFRLRLFAVSSIWSSEYVTV